MPGPAVKTVSTVTGKKGVPVKRRPRVNGPAIYGTLKTYGGQNPGGFKGGAGTGFGYMGSMMGGRSR